MHQPHDDVGTAASGFGLLGIVTRDENGVECHECGTWFRMLVQHLKWKHDLSVADYRARHGLPAQVPLTSLSTSALIGEASRERMETDPEGWARFEAAREEALPVARRRAAEASRRSSVGTKAIRAGQASQQFTGGTLDAQRWDERLAAFVAHWRATGSPPSRAAVDDGERSLAKWLQHQRAAWRRGELTTERVTALSAAGIDLSPGQGKRPGAPPT